MKLGEFISKTGNYKKHLENIVNVYGLKEEIMKKHKINNPEYTYEDYIDSIDPDIVIKNYNKNNLEQEIHNEFLAPYMLRVNDTYSEVTIMMKDKQLDTLRRQNNLNDIIIDEYKELIKELTLKSITKIENTEGDTVNKELIHKELKEILDIPRKIETKPRQTSKYI